MSKHERPLPDEIGRYRIVRLLGQGAMGRVYLAHDPVLDRDVAVKLLRDDLNIDPTQKRALIDRMRQEARASARVSHPNIVSLFDMGEDAELGLFLVFEYVEGANLKGKLERGAVGPLLCSRIAREVGSALTTAHGAGVLHRDIKPENIILSKTGAKVADFGIARVPDSTLTRDGGLLGTPAYSAPEAISNGAFSPSSDQFSMAASLYEAVSGRRAFPGEDAVAVASRISTEEPPPIAEVCGVDAHVDTVFARALSKNPRSRYSSCEEFGEALAEGLEASPRSAMPTLPDERHRREVVDTSSSRGTRIAVGGAAVGALVAIAAFRLTAQLREPPAPVIVTSAAPDAGAEMPVAWLEPAPKKRKRRRHPKPTTITDAEPKQEDGGVDAANADATSGAGPDGG